MEKNEHEGEFEPVFIAGNVREVTFVENALDAEGIEYEVSPGTFTAPLTISTTCFQGLIFYVLSGQAEYVRRLVSASGLGRGVIPGEESQF